MSDKSNNQGRAYEFVCLLSLGEEIGKFRPVNIVQNSSYLAAEYAWNTLSPEMKNNIQGEFLCCCHSNF